MQCGICPPPPAKNAKNLVEQIRNIKLGFLNKMLFNDPVIVWGEGSSQVSKKL